MLQRVRRGVAAVTAALATAILLGAGPGHAAEEARDRQAVIDRVVSATARVTLEKGGKVLVSGSGVVIASGVDAGGAPVSFLLTAAHVVENPDCPDIVVRFTAEAGSGRKYAATVVRREKPDRLDLALLKVSGVRAPSVPVALDAAPRLGEEIVIVGFPWGKRLGLYSGVVSQLPLDPTWDAPPGDEGEESLMVDASVVKGVSGGGVFRLATGVLIGIVEASQTTSIAVKARAETYSVKVPAPGETFVVPAARIRTFLDPVAPELELLAQTR